MPAKSQQIHKQQSEQETKKNQQKVQFISFDQKKGTQTVIQWLRKSKRDNSRSLWSLDC